MKTITAMFMMLLTPLSANALEVFACEPEWGALLEELAGDIVKITVATTAFQDPHQLQARPSLIAAVRRADLLVCTGAQLEIGWLPLLLRRFLSSCQLLGNQNPGVYKHLPQRNDAATGRWFHGGWCDTDRGRSVR